ncbi:MAG: twin-arginine translocase TatA/TatE family subunit [Bacteroidales bacterium]|nr:twin-arginine translocase TatA/TatE family subunit [Bacteroidales bacterium]
MITAINSMVPALLFLDISFGEIFIIVAVIFIIFGPQKIPEIARKVGKGMREIK